MMIELEKNAQVIMSKLLIFFSFSATMHEFCTNYFNKSLFTKILSFRKMKYQFNAVVFSFFFNSLVLESNYSLNKICQKLLGWGKMQQRYDAIQTSFLFSEPNVTFLEYFPYFEWPYQQLALVTKKERQSPCYILQP